MHRHLFLVLLFSVASPSLGQDIPEFVEDYIEEAADDVNRLSQDYYLSGRSAWQLLKADDPEMAYKLAAEMAGERVLDPFLTYFYEQLPTIARTKIEAPPVSSSQWLTHIEETGKGTDELPYQVPSLRVAELFLLSKGITPVDVILRPMLSSLYFKDEGISFADRLLAILQYRDPKTSELRWLTFEMDSYFYLTFREDDPRFDVSQRLAKVFNDCLDADVIACKLGLAWSKQEDNRHSWAFRDYLKFASQSAHAALKAGDNFAGFHYMRPNLEHAEFYWQLARNQGSVVAASRLGRLYGGLLDKAFSRIEPKQAESLLREAVAAGDRISGLYLIQLAADHSVVVVSEEEKGALLKAAAYADGFKDIDVIVAYANFLFHQNHENALEQACKQLERAIKEDKDAAGDFELHIGCDNRPPSLSKPAK